MKYRAARHHADRTNQKLYFCRINCQTLDEELPVQIQQLHKEQAIFHLYGAYLALLQEISHNYGLSLTKPNLVNIEQILNEKTQISPEVNQLKMLKEEGLIKQIITAYENCLYFPNLNKNQSLTTDTRLNADTIHVVNVSILSNTGSPMLETVRQWYQELESLIEQLRSNMQEY